MKPYRVGYIHQKKLPLECLRPGVFCDSLSHRRIPQTPNHCQLFVRIPAAGLHYFFKYTSDMNRFDVVFSPIFHGSGIYRVMDIRVKENHPDLSPTTFQQRTKNIKIQTCVLPGFCFFLDLKYLPTIIKFRFSSIPLLKLSTKQNGSAG